MRIASRLYPLFLFVLAVAGFTAPTLASAAEGSKVAIVDLRRILMESEKGKKANTEMQAEFEKRKKAIEKLQEQGIALQNELQTQGPLLSASAREKKEEELRTRGKEIQRRMADYEEEIKRLDQRLTEDILKGVSGIIEDHAKKNKIDVILDTTTSKPVYFDKAIDITDAIIAAYDRSGPAPAK